MTWPTVMEGVLERDSLDDNGTVMVTALVPDTSEHGPWLRLMHSAPDRSGHQMLEELIGRRLRVTVEVLP